MSLVTDFLQKSEIQELLADEDLDGIYDKYMIPRVLTKFFLDNAIDPLQYVNAIHQSMFMSLDIEKLDIPPRIRSIRYQAFKNCHKLETVNMPEGVVGIDTYAFFDCYNLKHIVMSEDLEEISSMAFSGCGNIQSILWRGIVYKTICDFFSAAERAGVYVYD